jgi:predicted heme/steroid binding protein
LPTEKQFTVEELAKFNGKDGRPAYIAFKGQVYDMSNSEQWEDGAHYAMHMAGTDLTEELEGAPHGEEVLESFMRVGKLKS